MGKLIKVNDTSLLYLVDVGAVKPQYEWEMANLVFDSIVENWETTRWIQSPTHAFQVQIKNHLSMKCSPIPRGRIS